MVTDSSAPHPTRDDLARLLGVAVESLADRPIAGRVHLHWPLQGGLLVRAPRLSHLGLSPRRNLIYAAQAFRRMAPSGAVPRLHRVLRVSPALPWGALVVDDVVGRPPRLPDDLPALGEALAAIHRLPLPDRRAPFVDPAEPLSYLLSVAREQLDPVRDRLPRGALRILTEEMDWAAGLIADSPGRPSPSLVAADTHPGNFRIGDDGRAVLLDVERPVYDSAGVDLAHASLPTSLSWDSTVSGGAGNADIVAFHRAWRAAVPNALADAVRPWVLPYRRLIWLRTTSWACAWAARNDLSTALASGDAATSDLARRLARFVEPAMMERARAGWIGPDAFSGEELVP
ncbi:MAG: aminoglycoside phosphotransferase family protein [Alphaproteobacteria bacterium]|nr:aminoglycoside phosphotransferase family protein [Alphaproteobacteria bacterium]